MKIFSLLYKKIIVIIFKLYYGKIDVGKVSILKKKKIIGKKNTYYFYEIENCRVYTNTNDVAYIRDNIIIDGPSLQIRSNGNNSNINNNTVLFNGTPKKHLNYNCRVFSLLTGLDANHNYFHWFFDSLPRFFLFKKFYKFKKNDFFLVQNYLHDYQKVSLKLLGVKNVINAYDVKHILAKQIIAVKFIRKHTNPPIWLTKHLSFFFNQKKFINKQKFNIFIDRSGVSSKVRDLGNKKELLNLLKKNNFKIIDPSKLNFLDEIKIFQNANIVAGIYGAGLTNIIFCNKKCKIIEFRYNKRDQLYENIANQMGLKFFSIYGKKINNSLTNRNFDGSIIVPLNKLSTILDKIKLF